MDSSLLSKHECSQPSHTPAAATGRPTVAQSGVVYSKTTPATPSVPGSNYALPNNQRYTSSVTAVVNYELPSAATTLHPCHPCYGVWPARVLPANVSSSSLTHQQFLLGSAYYPGYAAMKRLEYQLNGVHLTSPHQPLVQWQQPPFKNVEPVATAPPSCIQLFPPPMFHSNYAMPTGCGQDGQRIVSVPFTSEKYTPVTDSTQVATRRGQKCSGIEVLSEHVQTLMPPADVRLFGDGQAQVPHQQWYQRQQIVNSVDQLSPLRSGSSPTGIAQSTTPMLTARPSQSLATARDATVATQGVTERNERIVVDHVGNEMPVTTVGVFRGTAASLTGGSSNYVSEWCPLIGSAEYVNKPL